MNLEPASNGGRLQNQIWQVKKGNIKEDNFEEWTSLNVKANGIQAQRLQECWVGTLKDTMFCKLHEECYEGNMGEIKLK